MTSPQEGHFVVSTGMALSSDSGSAAGQPAQTIPVYYQVVKGDTLWSIAMRYGMALSDLIALNPQIKNPNLIHIGDEVRVS